MSMSLALSHGIFNQRLGVVDGGGLSLSAWSISRAHRRDGLAHLWRVSELFLTNALMAFMLLEELLNRSHVPGI